MNLDYVNIHSHTEYSNIRLRDSIIKPKDLILTANNLNYKGIAITDHESLSSHVKANKIYKDLKKDGMLKEDFKLVLGNEIYLIDDAKKKEIEEKKYVKYNHFILLAKNKNGYDGIAELSSIANSNSYFTSGMERVPTFKSDLVRVMKKYKGDIIASTACLGGELANLLENYICLKDDRYKTRAAKFVKDLVNIFGEGNVFIEIHPTIIQKGKDVNKLLLKLADHLKITPITSTDAHYLLKSHAKIHETYLKASDGDREVASFYATTYLHTRKEFHEEFTEFDKETVDRLITNTMKIYDMVEDIDLYSTPQIPEAKIDVDLTKKEIFKPYLDDYKYIKKFYESKEKPNLQLISLCAEGFLKLKQEFNEENLSRLDKELKITLRISENLKENLSEYFLSMYDLLNIAWEVSIIGPGRGSGVAWYINYLLEITQLNPIKNNLPEWRFMDESRIELPDRHICPTI